MFLIFNDIEKAQKALEEINKNMGFPDGKGTETWAVVQKAHEQDLWFFIAPNSKYLKDVPFDGIEPDISKYLPKIDLINLMKG